MMEKRPLVMLLLAFFFLSRMGYAQTVVAPAQKQAQRDACTQRLIKESYHMDIAADDLSILVYRVNDHQQYNNINKDLDSIRRDYQGMLSDSVKLLQNLTKPEAAKFNSMMKHLYWRMTLLSTNFTLFKNYQGQDLYAVQIDYAEDEIDRFLAITDSFRQFLNGMKATAQ